VRSQSVTIPIEQYRADSSSRQWGYQSMPDNNTSTILRNLTCIYCGRQDCPEFPLTKEHVIGRKFVPTGSFVTGRNLIAYACKSCNHEKSQLEDDISAITLLPDLGTSHDDPTLQALAIRKGIRSISRHTRTPVAQSYHRDKIVGTLMGGALRMSVDIIGPPHIGRERAHRLAYFHVSAFFYLITYDESHRTGCVFPGVFSVVDDASRSDWGNPLQRAFSAISGVWDSRIEMIGADGFFRIAIRRDPTAAEAWSFALEWNRYLRYIGFLGNLSLVQAHVDKLPILDFTQVDATRRMRTLVPLDEADDRLFLLSERTDHNV
jgi:hypothetical protein